jgi:hypothetical protein
VGDWEPVFTWMSHSAFGAVLALVGLVGILLLTSEAGSCNGSSIRSNDFCLSGSFFDNQDMAQCIAHSKCCQWNARYETCESARGDQACTIAGARSSSICQLFAPLVVAAVGALALGVAIIANVYRLRTHNMLGMLNTPASLWPSIMLFDGLSFLVSISGSGVAWLANDLNLMISSGLLAAVAVYSELCRSHTRRSSRAIHLLLLVAGIQAITMGLYTSATYEWTHEGCVNASSAGLASTPQPAIFSSPSSCAKRCFGLSTSTLSHQYDADTQDLAARASASYDDIRGRRLQEDGSECVEEVYYYDADNPAMTCIDGCYNDWAPSEGHDAACAMCAAWGHVCNCACGTLPHVDFCVDPGNAVANPNGTAYECRHLCETGESEDQNAAGCHGDNSGNHHEDQVCVIEGVYEPGEITPMWGDNPCCYWCDDNDGDGTPDYEGCCEGMRSDGEMGCEDMQCEWMCNGINCEAHGENQTTCEANNGVWEVHESCVDAIMMQAMLVVAFDDQGFPGHYASTLWLDDFGSSCCAGYEPPGEGSCDNEIDLYVSLAHSSPPFLLACHAAAPYSSTAFVHAC